MSTSTTTNGLFNRLFGKTLGRQSPVLELGVNGVHSFWPTSQTLHVVSGRLWVSLNGFDFVVEENEQLYLPSSSSYPAVLSNLSKRTVFYEIK
jgi:glyoxylate utilization-related uncharacterized protein